MHSTGRGNTACGRMSFIRKGGKQEMKKLFTNKKIISFILVLTMVFAMSATAFAGEGDTAASTFVTSASAPISTVVTILSEDPNNPSDPAIELGTSTVAINNPDSFTTQFSVPTGAAHQYAGKATVLDALMMACASDDIGVPVEASDIGWDTYQTPNGAYVSSYFGQSTVTVDSNYSNVPGESYWTGYSWVIRVNGQVLKRGADGVTLVAADPDTLVTAPYYASNQLLNNPVTGGYQQVNSIEFSYELSTTTW